MATVQASRNKLFHSYEKHSAPNKNSKLAATLQHVKYNIAAFQCVSVFLAKLQKVRHGVSTHTRLSLFYLFYLRSETLTQTIKRKSTPETRAGQYMCDECGQIFDTKKQVDNHLYVIHNPHYTRVNGKIHLNC
jgi:hypothetical protein